MLFKDFVQINPTVRLAKDQHYPFVPMETLTPGRRYVKAPSTRVSGGGAKFQHGDTLFARITPCLENGKIAQFTASPGQSGFGSTEYWVFRAKEGISDPAFVYYLATTDVIRKPAEKSMAGASGRQRADIAAIGDLEIQVPDLSVQRRIASILSVYDDLIENNTRRITILEEMARRIYKEWFVQFRFPGHEKTRMIESELGPVPEGWSNTKFEKLCTSIEDGDWIETKDQGGHDFRLLQISNVGVNQFVETGNYRYISADTFGRLRCREVLPGHILVARMPKPIGRAWLVTAQPWRMVTAVDVAIIAHAPEKTSPEFLLHFLNSDATLAAFAGQTSGTTRPRITRRQIAGMELLAPPSQLAHQFGDLIRPMNQAIALHTRRNANLRTTRDLLLPKLISGELDVSNLPEPEVCDA